MSKEYYRLPDYRTVTTSSRKYIKAWKDLAKPIEKQFGLKLAGFDPDFLFIEKPSKDKPQSASLDLPLWFVKQLNETLTEKK